MGLIAMTVALLVQPVLYFAVTVIPDMVLIIVSIIFLVFLAFDIITIYTAVKAHEKPEK